MQAAEESHQRALAAEHAAFAALVQAEEELQRLVRAHRPGSPTVDDAVTELADRRDEYDEACEASVRADTSCHNEHGDVIMNDRHLITKNVSRLHDTPLAQCVCSRGLALQMRQARETPTVIKLETRTAQGTRRQVSNGLAMRR